MPPQTKAITKGPSNQKKEKVFHPLSRKAGQIVRTHLRKTKLDGQAKKRNNKQLYEVDVFNFFFNALPPDGHLSLEELHVIVHEIWLTRHNEELEHERATRRKGRPKSTREHKLEEIKIREADEYRTGLEIPDLTHQVNVELFRQWDQKEYGYLQLLRYIRISGTEPGVSAISRHGTHPLLSTKEPAALANSEEQEIVVETNA